MRTPANRRRCTFPNCNERDRLHNVKRKIRFKILKAKKICIPDGARVCEEHSQIDTWNNLNSNTDQLTKFSAKQVEDMLQLLSDSGPKISLEIPGSYFYYLFVCNNGTISVFHGLVPIFFCNSNLKIVVLN